MAYVSLEDLYTNLSPIAIENKSNTVKKDIFDGVADMIYDPNGKSFLYSEIQAKIKEHFAAADAEGIKAEFSVHFNGIGVSGPALEGDEYWKYRYRAHGAASNIPTIKEVFGTSYDDSFPDISVFSIKGPRISPQSRGTKKIDLFLNYTPSLVVAQMVPYLDVRFKSKGASASNITTPSIIRFLLGSGPVSNLSPADAFLQGADFKAADAPPSGSKDQENTSKYGMEMFLMPQTLTNMDTLGISENGLTRLNAVKPFIPFASIESFDITILNAGAGAFAHKKGSLKIKVHDKARLPEISEFIKGTSGFNRSTIETVYGWSAPQDRASFGDEYISFINDNMKVKDMWLVSNCQFGFDGSGQANISIEMMSQAAKTLQDKTIVGAETGSEFFRAVGVLSELSGKITGVKHYNKDSSTAKVFNAIASPGDFSALAKISTELSGKKERLKNLAAGANLDDDERHAYTKAVDIVCKPGVWAKLKEDIGSHITEKFKKAATGADPFLYNLALHNTFFNELHDSNTKKNIYAEITKPDTKKGEKKQSKDIVSFGKLFLTFICSQISKNDCDEVQVFFYGLSDECGYMSGASISEFPIDMMALRKAYEEFVKKTLNLNVTIESFLSIVADCQFSNNTAAAYGLSKFYGPADPKKENKREVRKEQGIESSMQKFFEEWGDIKTPIIEMFAETTEAAEGKVIKRIHVYDRQNSSYSFQQDILDAGPGNIVIGKIDKKKVRDTVNKLGLTFEKLSQQHKKNLQETNAANEKLTSDITKALPVSQASTENVLVESSGIETINISKRGSVKLFLMKSVPTISIGTNGSLVLSVSAASKSDGTQGAINIIAAAQGKNKGKANTPSIDGLTDANNMPLRSVPMQVSMSTLGIPTAQLYQTFFIDFNTGTTIDNIYSASQIQHSISQGKFTTNWTFIYQNGYAKLYSPPTAAAVITAAGKIRIDEDADRREKKAEEAKKARAAKPKK